MSLSNVSTAPTTGDIGEWARRQPEKLAVVMGSGAMLTYADLDVRSNALAQRLFDLGLRFGDHVAVLMENRVEYLIAVWAAQRSGLVMTPVNWHLAASEAAYVIDNCGARIVLTSSEQIPLIDELRKLTPGVKHWLVAGDRSNRYEPMDENSASQFKL